MISPSFGFESMLIVRRKSWRLSMGMGKVRLGGTVFRGQGLYYDGEKELA